jgi:hypothetical protein
MALLRNPALSAFAVLGADRMDTMKLTDLPIELLGQILRIALLEAVFDKDEMHRMFEARMVCRE